MGVLGQWPIEELQACRGDGLRQLLGELACRSTGHLYLVGHSGWVRARCAPASSVSLATTRTGSPTLAGRAVSPAPPPSPRVRAKLGWSRHDGSATGAWTTPRRSRSRPTEVPAMAGARPETAPVSTSDQHWARPSCETSATTMVTSHPPRPKASAPRCLHRTCSRHLTEMPL